MMCSNSFILNSYTHICKYHIHAPRYTTHTHTHTHAHTRTHTRTHTHIHTHGYTHVTVRFPGDGDWSHIYLNMTSKNKILWKHWSFMITTSPTYLFIWKEMFVGLCAAFWNIFSNKTLPRLPMQITWPWPPVGRFSYGLVTIRQKKMWT